jgi:hypothetical protein
MTRLAASTIALASLLASGCVQVMPWERGRLASPDMTFGGAEELHSAEAHATEVREGSVGGFDGGGGGCGCN